MQNQKTESVVFLYTNKKQKEKLRKHYHLKLQQKE